MTDYNNWALAVNEDQGSLMDGHAGIGSTTGDWQHVAVRSSNLANKLCGPSTLLCDAHVH